MDADGDAAVPEEKEEQIQPQVPSRYAVGSPDRLGRLVALMMPAAGRELAPRAAAAHAQPCDLFKKLG